VADEKRDAPRPFDVRTVEYLLKLMTDHGLSEVDLTEGDQRIRLRKEVTVAPAALPTVAHAPVHHATPATAASPPPPPARNLLEIKASLVGTFYRRPKQDQPEFVTVGAKITPKTVICVIEAMKLFNQIEAEVSGIIAEVCVKDGDPVEFNQVLFRVEPA